jgi:hypothetical protein
MNKQQQTNKPQQAYVKSPANQIGKSAPVELNVHTAPPMKIEKMDEAPPNTVFSRVGPR